MQVGIEFGRERLALEVPESKWIGVRRAPPAPPLTDVAAAMRNALEAPVGFPALSRALTPDDHVVIVVDEHLTRLPELLAAVLEYLTQARVAAEAITLLCPPSSSRQPWLESLPEAFEDVRLVMHNPDDRRQLSYLAATRRGQRVYLNRAVVDAEQAIILTAARYDHRFEPVKGESALYPALGDAATRQGALERLARGATAPLGRQATEVAWLLGAPFFIQVVEGSGDAIAAIVAGLADSNTEVQRLQDIQWRRRVERSADMVIAGVAGDPARHTFADLARALAAAARVVASGGRIVLLSQAEPVLGPGAEMIRQAENPEQALEALRREHPPDLAPALEWANAAAQAKIYLLSGLADETAEELFAIRLEGPAQVQRLVDTGGSVLLLDDADKVLTVLEE